MDDVQVHLLGRFQVHRDGREVPATAFGGRKVRALLRVLAVRRPGVVPHDVLAEALWPDHLPADPAGNLNVLVNRARRAVGDPGIVVTGVGGYALGPCRLDVEAFTTALVAARQAASAGNSLAALADAEAALAVWAEPLAEDVYADWALEPRRRLLGEHIEALELAAAAALAIGGTATAAGYAAEAVAAEPLRESLVLLLARALAARGDRAAALARLAELRRLLADELGVDPSPETEELQLRLLRGEPVAPVAAPPTPVRAPVPAPRTGGAAPMRFVGRDAEVAAVRAQLAEGGIAAVGGVAGAGKSRLVAEALRSSTLPEITGRAFQPERAEAWGLARSVLREALAVDASVGETLPDRVRDALTELLPELAAATPAPLDGESRRALVLAGGLRILEAASASGAVLVADDLQWADPSSLLLLTSALARLPQLRAVLVFRSDELPAGALAPLREVRDVVDVPVGPLPPDAVTALAGDAALAGALLAATDGTPFAVSEVLRELATRGAVEAGPGGGWRTVGPQAVELAADLGRDGQRRAVRRRVARHAAGDDVLPLVALLAREVPARIVAEAAGLPERAVLDRLSELAGADLLRLGEQGWATAHDLVGETVVADLSAPERGRLHGLLARALESGDADASEIAGHHRGAGDATAAADWYARAARTALDGQATREAAALASTGLDLRPRPPARAALLDVRADARSARGDLPGAQEDLHEALRAQPGTGRARRLARLAMTTFGAQDPRHAAELAEMAVVAAGDDDRARAFALETAAIIDMNLGSAGRAATRSEEALSLYRRLGDGGGAARILDGRAMATFLDGRIREAVDQFDRVAALFQAAGDLLRVVTPRSTHGHGLVFLGRPAEGLAQASEALRLARDLDSPEGQSYALWHRSEALSALGRPAEAEADAREALSVAVGCGHRGWTATAYRALGIAHQEQGALDEAAVAFSSSAAVAGEDLTLFASWAASRAAMVAVAQNRLVDGARLVRAALATGPPLSGYEARLAAVELAVARRDPDADARAREAEAVARAGGHVRSATRLAEIAVGLRA